MSTQPVLTGTREARSPHSPETPNIPQAPGRSAPRAIDPAIADAVRTGLTASPKWLPAWLFYDGEGSRLFERITQLPEYYLTRTERAIFTGYADGIVGAALRESHRVSAGSEAPQALAKLRIFELGAGSASKTGVLLAAAVRAQGQTDYLPIDVSATAMQAACSSLSQTLSGVTVHPQIANYVTEALHLPPHDGPTLALYIGSSIGNFAPAEAVSILRNVRHQLRAGDSILLGTDLVKDPATLEAAYCDSDGVTEAFNLNLLRRLNRELGAGFDLSTFRHVATFNRSESRIEMHLRSTRRQTVRIPSLGLTVPFEAGESIHTENSYKFTPESLARLMADSGYAVTSTWTDERNWFAVTLATVPASGANGHTPGI